MDDSPGKGNSYIGSPGFGLIHSNTISAAVLQDAGFKTNERDRTKPAPFDAITLAPNFDLQIGRRRVNEVANFITQ